MHRVFAVLLMTCILSIPAFPQATSSVPPPQVRGEDPACQVISVPLTFPEAGAQADDSGKYLCLQIEGADGYSLTPGAPMLPMWGRMLGFPPGTRILGAELSDVVTDSHMLPRKVFPAPEPVPNVAGAGPAPVFEGPVYSRNAFFPEEQVSRSLTTGMGEAGGIEAHLFVKVFPVRYNPVTGQVIQLKCGTLNVRYSLPAPMPSRGNETYDILVLSPAEFESEMDRYNEEKESLGFTIRTVNLTTVYSGAIFNTSSGRDNQEKIKLFLAAAAENWSVRYAVLVGDTDKFPTRTAYINDIDGTSTPSDLYYGDLFKNGNATFCDWDSDRDNRFSESSSSSANPDAVDFDPDVSVGRLPASNAAELRAIINKTIAYAANVSGGWFQNATLVGSDTFANRDPWYDTSGVAEGEYGCDRASTYVPLFNFSKFYETKGTFNAQNIKDCLNRGEGLALFADHGNVGGVVYPSSGGVGLTSSTASSLTNGPKLPLSVLDACLTHAIDSGECLGEYLVLNPNGGSINSVGATRIGYGMFGAWHTYANSGYMMVHMMEHYGNGTIMPGPMLDSTKRGYLADVGIWDYADVKTLVEYIQLGDPVTFIGGSKLDYLLENSSLQADPGVPVFYHLQVQNTALHTEHVDLSVVGGKWNHTLDTPLVTLPARSSVDITIRVDVDPLANAYETDSCTLLIIPKSTGLPIKVNLTTGANCVRKVGFGVERSSFFADPGENITINYTILNEGNIAESVLLDIRSVDPSVWRVTATLASRILDARSRADGQATLAVPQKCLAGTYSFQIWPYTEGLPSKASPIQVIVKEVSGFEMHALDDHVYVAVRTRFELNVENTGNHYDHCGLSVDGIPGGWSVTCPARLGLEAYANTTVALIATPGRYTVAGDYVIGVSLFSNAGVFLRTLNLTATVNQISSLEFFCPDANQVVERGSDASFGLAFRSMSNFGQALSLETSGLPGGWGWSAAPDHVLLAPFSGGESTLTIQVPSGAPAGIYILTVGASTSNWKKTIDVTVEVLEQRALSAYLDRCQDRVLPGDVCRFVLSLVNTGNCPDSYVLSTEGPLSASFSRNTIYLDPGSTVTVNVDIGAPDMAPAGDHVMLLTVESARDRTVKRTLRIDIAVERISRLSLDYDDASLAGQGAEGGFWLLVSNRGPQTETVRLESLSLSWDAGCSAITVEPGASREVLVGYTVPAGLDGGDYEIAFTASSEMQYWNVTHTVTVPAAPPIPGPTISVSNSSQYSLALLLAVILVLASVAVLLAVRIRGKKQNGKAS